VNAFFVRPSRSNKMSVPVCVGQRLQKINLKYHIAKAELMLTI
jgi:hypothetical protein